MPSQEIDYGERFKFARKTSACDNLEYNVEDAENKDLLFLIENTCISCSTALKDNDVKIIPPRYVQERDKYVRNGIVRRRRMCVKCYNKLRLVTLSQKYIQTGLETRTRIIKSILNSMFAKH